MQLPTVGVSDALDILGVWLDPVQMALRTACLLVLGPWRTRFCNLKAYENRETCVSVNRMLFSMAVEVRAVLPVGGLD